MSHYIVDTSDLFESKYQATHKKNIVITSRCFFIIYLHAVADPSWVCIARQPLECSNLLTKYCNLLHYREKKTSAVIGFKRLTKLFVTFLFYFRCVNVDLTYFILKLPK